MSEHHHPLSPSELLSYMRAQPWAIEASVTPQGGPQAAVVGVAISDRWALLFDTVVQSRKHQNLVKNFNVDPPLIQEWDASAIAGWLK
jgi:pyridoxine/pyridoxamine 5'-phosphate oxidase